jgi:transporter family protein
VSVFAKIGLQRVDPDVAQFVRTAIVLAATAAIVLANGKLVGISQWRAQTWVLLVLSGLATAASWVCYFRALDVGSAARVAAVDKLSVAIVAVAAVVFLGDRLGITGWVGVVLVTTGLMLISLKS